MRVAATTYVKDCALSRLPSYDSTKLNIGTLFEKVTGATYKDNWVGPFAITTLRPNEQSTAIPAVGVHVLDVGNNTQWLFYIDGNNAGANRRVGLYIINTLTWQAQWKGFISATIPPGGTATARQFEAIRYLYSTGTATCAGATTAVTGTGALWGTARISGGARIGFGSTDPTQISTWYELAPASVPADNSLTLSVNGPVVSGVPYVIEELRLAITTTNGTATSGGLMLVKGLTPDIFLTNGTTINAGVTTDNVRAVFWLKDASTETNTAAFGYASEPFTGADWTTHYCYIGDTVASPKIFKYNLRAALAGLAAGASTSAWVYTTGTGAIAGSATQNTDMRYAAPPSSSPPNTPAIYFVVSGSNKIYRAPTAGITNGSTVFLTDSNPQAVPGSANTQTNAGAFSTLEYLDTFDKFFVITNGASGDRCYLTQYRTDGSQWDYALYNGLNYSNQVAADASLPDFPCMANNFATATTKNGVLYLLRTAATGSVTSFINMLWMIPLGADWSIADATSQHVIFPKIATPGATKYYNVWVQEAKQLGDTVYGFGPEPFRVYYRTSGIDDNTGGWTLVDDAGDMSGVSGASFIQFRITFRTIGITGIPARVIGISVNYENSGALPPELVWAVGDSNNADGTVGMYQTTTASWTTLTINYYRRDNNNLVLTQASSGTTNGVFEYYNGSSWTAGLGTNAAGTRIRFRPTAGLPSTDVYAMVSAT